MSNESKDKSVFPHEWIDGNGEKFINGGLSKQAYAAIHLKVPLSGTPWLDEMIQKARRDEFAKASLIGRLSNPIFKPGNLHSKTIFKDGDALIKASSFEESKAKGDEQSTPDDGMGEK